MSTTKSIHGEHYHRYWDGKQQARYRGPLRFDPTVNVVVDGVTFWTEQWSDREYLFHFKTPYCSGPVMSWKDSNEHQRVIDAFVFEHEQQKKDCERHEMSTSEFKAKNQAATWKFAFWILVAFLAVLLKQGCH